MKEGIAVYFNYGFYKILGLFIWTHMSFIDICSDF